MPLSVSNPPGWVACFESDHGPILGGHPLQPLTRTLTDALPYRPTSRLSYPDAGGIDLRASSLAKRRGRWVGVGLGECPVRVRFHDDSHQMTERTDLITSDRCDQLSSFGDDTESSGHLPSGELMVKLTYNRVPCGENLPRHHQGLVEPTKPGHQTRSNSTLSPLNPGPVEGRDPMGTTQPESQAFQNRRVHTCGGGSQGGL